MTIPHPPQDDHKDHNVTYVVNDLTASLQSKTCLHGSLMGSDVNFDAGHRVHTISILSDD